RPRKLGRSPQGGTNPAWSRCGTGPAETIPVGVRGTGYGVRGLMNISAVPARTEDLGTLEELYRSLAEEMEALHRMWPLTGGLDEPVTVSFAEALADPDTIVLLGYLDDVPFGFLLARVEDMLTQAGDEKIGVIRLIYVDHPAREVAIG